MLIPGVDEQLAQVGSDLLDKLAGGVDVALQGEEGVRSMPWIWTGSPSRHGPTAHSPLMGRQDSQSSAPRAPGWVGASR